MNTEEMEMVTESEAPWMVHLDLMDLAIAKKNASAAVRAWRDAYAEAIGSAGWPGIIEVAAACLRIGEIPGFRKACEAKARETYWTALFRARQQGSFNGVLEAAHAFGVLGDRAMVEECIRIAGRLAAQEPDDRSADQVRALSARLAERFLTEDTLR